MVILSLLRRSSGAARPGDGFTLRTPARSHLPDWRPDCSWHQHCLSAALDRLAATIGQILDERLALAAEVRKW
jgi:hypothetical protein